MQASKFWGRGSDSEEESEEFTTSEDETTSESGSEYESSETESSEESEEGGASRFLMGSSDSESEDERRVVRSAKDKAIEELAAVCNEIRVCVVMLLWCPPLPVPGRPGAPTNVCDVSIP